MRKLNNVQKTRKSFTLVNTKRKENCHEITMFIKTQTGMNNFPHGDSPDLSGQAI